MSFKPLLNASLKSTFLCDKSLAKLAYGLEQGG